VRGEGPDLSKEACGHRVKRHFPRSTTRPPLPLFLVQMQRTLFLPLSFGRGCPCENRREGEGRVQGLFFLVGWPKTSTTTAKTTRERPKRGGGGGQSRCCPPFWPGAERPRFERAKAKTRLGRAWPWHRQRGRQGGRRRREEGFWGLSLSRSVLLFSLGEGTVVVVATAAAAVLVVVRALSPSLVRSHAGVESRRLRARARARAHEDEKGRRGRGRRGYSSILRTTLLPLRDSQSASVNSLLFLSLSSSSMAGRRVGSVSSSQKMPRRRT